MSQILSSQILGEGKPLVILHGYFGMSDNWKSLGNQFAEHFEVHLLDLRNHGRSFHSDEFTYELMADDLLNYLQHHHLQNVYFIGHSMGGKAAMLFACLHPNFVEKLVVVDIGPKAYAPHHNSILAGLNSINFDIQNTRGKVDEQLTNYIPEFGVRQFLLKNVYWKDKGVLDFRFNLTSLTDNNSEVGKPLPNDSFFEKETLFLKGEKSNYILPTDEILIKKHFLKAKIDEISNAGHWLHAENPEEFFEKVLKFLKS